ATDCGQPGTGWGEVARRVGARREGAGEGPVQAVARDVLEPVRQRAELEVAPAAEPAAVEPDRHSASLQSASQGAGLASISQPCGASAPATLGRTRPATGPTPSTRRCPGRLDRATLDVPFPLSGCLRGALITSRPKPEMVRLRATSFQPRGSLWTT